LSMKLGPWKILHSRRCSHMISWWHQAIMLSSLW
jgi:hypothetical protein